MQEEGAALSQATRSRVEIQITKVRNAAYQERMKIIRRLYGTQNRICIYSVRQAQDKMTGFDKKPVILSLDRRWEGLEPI